MPPQATSTLRERRALIRRLLDDHRVASQAELLELLARNGCETTQPVLSRDLRKLNAAKRGGVYVLLEESERVTPLASLRALLRGARPAGPHMLVITTEPGAANSIARALEAEGFDGLVGTIAGDDTVFAALDTPGAGRRLQDLVLSLIR